MGCLFLQPLPSIEILEKDGDYCLQAFSGTGRLIERFRPHVISKNRANDLIALYQDIGEAQEGEQYLYHFGFEIDNIKNEARLEKEELAKQLLEVNILKGKSGQFYISCVDGGIRLWAYANENKRPRDKNGCVIEKIYDMIPYPASYEEVQEIVRKTRDMAARHSHNKVFFDYFEGVF